MTTSALSGGYRAGLASSGTSLASVAFPTDEQRSLVNRMNAE